MSASLVNDVGSTIVIGDEPRRMLPSAAGIVAQARGWFVAVNWKTSAASPSNRQSNVAFEHRCLQLRALSALPQCSSE